MPTAHDQIGSAFLAALAVVLERPEQRPVDVGTVPGAFEIGAQSRGGLRIDRQWVRRRNLVQMVDPGSIPSGDLGLLLFRAVLQNLLNNLPAPGEGGFDVGII